MAEVKYASLEVDGVDFGYPIERLLIAGDTKLNTSVNTLVGVDIQEMFDRLCGSTNSQAPTYLENGDLDINTFYSSSTQIIANRLVDVTMIYDESFNPITETWKEYDTLDGTTVLKTITLTHTWVNDEIIKSEASIT